MTDHTGGDESSRDSAAERQMADQVAGLQARMEGVQTQLDQLSELAASVGTLTTMMKTHVNQRSEEESGGAVEGAAERGGAEESADARSVRLGLASQQTTRGGRRDESPPVSMSSPSGRQSGEAWVSNPPQISPNENPQHALNRMLDIAASLNEHGISVNETFVLHLFVAALPDEYNITKHQLRQEARLTKEIVLKNVTIEHQAMKKPNSKGARGAEKAYVADSGRRRRRRQWPWTASGRGRNGRKSERGRGGSRSGGRGGGSNSSGGGGEEERKESSSDGKDGGSTEKKKFRCFTCGHFGHTMNYCTTKKADYLPQCEICSGWGHSNDKCPTEETILAQIVHTSADTDVDSLENQAFCAVTATGSWARSAAPGKRVAGLSSSRADPTLMPQGNRHLSSFVPRGGGYSDSMVVYGIVGLNVAGTVALFLHETQGTGGPFLFGNFMVSTYTTLTQGRLYTLFTSNFSHSHLWNGAIFSYMMHTLGPTAIQQLGRRQFLALYLLGGAFSQLCQVVGPEIARRLDLPAVLQVDRYFISSGGSGAVLAVLAWYCASFPGSQIILLVVPVQTGVAGALYLGATLYQVVTNGAEVPFLGGPTQEIWRTLGATAAGVLMAVAARGRRGGGRYKFIQRY
eukprot:g14275.t1